jgi:hypothetical protein
LDVRKRINGRPKVGDETCIASRVGSRPCGPLLGRLKKVFILEVFSGPMILETSLIIYGLADEDLI